MGQALTCMAQGLQEQPGLEDAQVDALVLLLTRACHPPTATAAAALRLAGDPDGIGDSAAAATEASGLAAAAAGEPSAGAEAGGGGGGGGGSTTAAAAAAEAQFRGKAALRLGVACVAVLLDLLPAEVWASAWQQVRMPVDTAYWFGAKERKSKEVPVSNAHPRNVPTHRTRSGVHKRNLTVRCPLRTRATLPSHTA